MIDAEAPIEREGLPNEDREALTHKRSVQPYGKEVDREVVDVAPPVMDAEAPKEIEGFPSEDNEMLTQIKSVQP